MAELNIHAGVEKLQERRPTLLQRHFPITQEPGRGEGRIERHRSTFMDKHESVCAGVVTPAGNVSNPAVGRVTIL